jgi:hypothetical protein
LGAKLEQPLFKNKLEKAIQERVEQEWKGLIGKLAPQRLRVLVSYSSLCPTAILERVLG